ncbi:LOW QUALITY PROTEIN: Hypothetical protein PHPALM_3261 [Phytophthora palmivora]|uniref:Uncharacterized protein n=1 Tax=Phytophthora palmivora TaxID=4796 RepID=A0A2P4YMW7_9STRA|nr:LOW QUALITY PROTEIN: Hypothetical protein PHPALM_3261 [Phytophthora palmivora]
MDNSQAISVNNVRANRERSGSTTELRTDVNTAPGAKRLKTPVVPRTIKAVVSEGKQRVIGSGKVTLEQ